MHLKPVAYSISSDIESRDKIPWLPTPQNILESDELLELDKWLFNLIAWIVSPSAAIVQNCSEYKVISGWFTARVQPDFIVNYHFNQNMVANGNQWSETARCWYFKYRDNVYAR